MPAIATRSCSLLVGGAVEASTTVAATTLVPPKVSTANSWSRCSFVAHVDSLRRLEIPHVIKLVSGKSCKFWHHGIRVSCGLRQSVHEHPSASHSAQLPPSSFRKKHAEGRVGKHKKRQAGVTAQAVRVEDLSPAVPQPNEEEPVEIKVAVGFVGETSDTVFAVRKMLPQPSVLLTVTLPKPLGIVFEESRIRKRVTVAELVAGGNAERLARVVQMFGSVTKAKPDGASVRTEGAVQVGDVLRGLTTTQCIVDLFGVRAPRRATVYFDTQNRRWGEIMGAFAAVRVSDGEITLVLERRLDRNQVQ